MGGALSHSPVPTCTNLRVVGDDAPAEEWRPTVEDAFAVQRCLFTYVPVELATLIINFAEYWPTAIAHMVLPGDSLMLWTAAKPENDYNASTTCLNTPPLGQMLLDANPNISELEHIVIKQIRFKISSHDQGNYNNSNTRHIGSSGFMDSWSWIEARIMHPPRRPTREHLRASLVCVSETFTKSHERFILRAPDTCFSIVEDSLQHDASSWLVQKNLRGEFNFTHHQVTWKANNVTRLAENRQVDMTGSGLGSGFIHSLRLDDSISLVARAQHPGSENFVQAVWIEVFYSV